MIRSISQILSLYKRDRNGCLLLIEMRKLWYGASSSGKTQGFDPCIRGFESLRPSQFLYRHDREVLKNAKYNEGVHR